MSRVVPEPVLRSKNVVDQQDVDQDKRDDYARTVSKCLRLCWVWASFQTSQFAACTTKLTKSNTSNATATRCAIDQHQQQRKAAERAELISCPTSGRFYKLANSIKLKRAFAYYSLIIIALYAYWASESIIMALLDLNAFASFRYIDCYWLGRFTLFGRVSMGTKYTCLQVTLFILLIRLLTTFNGLDLYVEVFDFLHKDLAEVERHACRHDLTRHRMPKPVGVAGCGPPPAVDSGSNNRNDDDDDDDEEEEDDDDDECYDIYYKRYERATETRTAAQVGRFHSRPERELNRNFAFDFDFDKMHCEQDAVQADRHYDDTFFATIDCQADDLVILKLNRSPKNWHKIQIAMLAGLAALVAAIAFWITLVLYVMVPSIVTKRGFEYVYPNCIDYIRKFARANPDRAGEFAFIYEAPKQQETGDSSVKLPPTHQAISSSSSGGSYINKILDASAIVLPMQDFVSGRYHLFRMTVDFVKSVAFFLDAPLFVLTYILLQVPVYFDIRANAAEICKRLIRLRELKWQQLTVFQLISTGRISIRRKHLHANQMFPIEPAIVLEACNEPNRAYMFNFEQLNYNSIIETLLLQALLLDHFKVLKRYNNYLSLSAFLGALMWFGFTCTLMMWLAIWGSDSIDSEFYIAEVSVSAALSAYLIALSDITRINRKLYPLIASLMALDDARSLTKKRWMRIVKYYYPRPIYSTKLFARELNTLLVVKIFAWTFSAMFLMLSFFNMRKGTH